MLKQQGMRCHADGYDTAQDDLGASIYCVRAVIRKMCGAKQCIVPGHRVNLYYHETTCTFF
jgi:hypothetical protein